MKTSTQWWNDVSSDPEKIIAWLKDQYHGERTAATRVASLLVDYPEMSESAKTIIQRIAVDESTHAEWVGELLTSRGITPEILNKESRYWDKVLPKEAVTFEEICAVGHHAEEMRLERIRVIAKDENHPDIAKVFAAILPDEEFHARAFEKLSSPECIAEAEISHLDGRNSLGLV